MIEIILGCIVIIALLMIIVIVYHNKFLFSIIKIDEAENNIDVLFQKKLELLNRAKSIVRKELKLKKFLDQLNDFKDKEINHFEMNEFLRTSYNELVKVLDDNEKLFKSEALVSILGELNDNEEKISGTIKFYNDTVVVFNQLVAAFPSNIIAFFCHYKRKDFYSNEKRKMFEILNDK